MADTTCANCHYWENIPTTSDGSCRRHAPTPNMTDVATITTWPTTSSTAWCGEFTPAAEPAP